MAAVAEIHESKRNALMVIRSGYRALEHMLYSELTADGSQIPGFSRQVGPHALRSDDFELRHACKTGGNFVLHSGGKKSILGISAGVFERQHCDRPIHSGRGFPALIGEGCQTNECDRQRQSSCGEHKMFSSLARGGLKPPMATIDGGK